PAASGARARAASPCRSGPAAGRRPGTPRRSRPRPDSCAAPTSPRLPAWPRWRAGAGQKPWHEADRRPRMRVELTQGAWAEHREDIDRVSNRERKRVVKAYNVEGSDMDKGIAVTDAVLALIVTAWSFSWPLPSENPESLEEIPAHDYDLLVKVATEAQGR